MIKTVPEASPPDDYEVITMDILRLFDSYKWERCKKLCFLDDFQI